jgi:hypothetical protein
MAKIAPIKRLKAPWETPRLARTDVLSDTIEVVQVKPVRRIPARSL